MRLEQTVVSNYQEQFSAFICKVFINRAELSNSTQYLTDTCLYLKENKQSKERSGIQYTASSASS